MCGCCPRLAARLGLLARLTRPDPISGSRVCGRGPLGGGVRRLGLLSEPARGTAGGQGRAWHKSATHSTNPPCARDSPRRGGCEANPYINAVCTAYFCAVDVHVCPSRSRYSPRTSSTQGALWPPAAQNRTRASADLFLPIRDCLNGKYLLFSNIALGTGSKWIPIHAHIFG